MQTAVAGVAVGLGHDREQDTTPTRPDPTRPDPAPAPAAAAGRGGAGLWGARAKHASARVPAPPRPLVYPVAIRTRATCLLVVQIEVYGSALKGSRSSHAQVTLCSALSWRC